MTDPHPDITPAQLPLNVGCSSTTPYVVEAASLTHHTTPDPYKLRNYLKTDEDLTRIRRARGKAVEGFYREQNERIQELLSPVFPGVGRESDEQLGRVKLAVYGSTVVNVILFGLQLYAAIASGSLSLFATMADSFMDLLSGVILLVAARAVHKENPSRYPTVELFSRVGSTCAPPSFLSLLPL